MARARSLKPGLFKNEILGVADPLYTLAFQGLWILADREGRLEDRPLRAKAEIFPYRADADMNAMIDWLQAEGFLIRYSVTGKQYIQILNFCKHQNPHKNEVASDIPPYESERVPTKSEDVPIKSEQLALTPDSLNLTPDSRDKAPDKPAKFDPMQHLIALEVTEPVARDWLALRKTKRAPATETAIAGIISEADKASMTLQSALETCCKRGWQGFEAKWLQNDARAGPAGYAQKRDEERKEVGDILTGRKKTNERASSNDRDIPGECARVA